MNFLVLMLLTKLLFFCYAESRRVLLTRAASIFIKVWKNTILWNIKSYKFYLGYTKWCEVMSNYTQTKLYYYSCTYRNPTSVGENIINFEKQTLLIIHALEIPLVRWLKGKASVMYRIRNTNHSLLNKKACA